MRLSAMTVRRTASDMVNGRSLLPVCQASAWDESGAARPDRRNKVLLPDSRLAPSLHPVAPASPTRAEDDTDSSRLVGIRIRGSRVAFSPQARQAPLFCWKFPG